MTLPSFVAIVSPARSYSTYLTGTGNASPSPKTIMSVPVLQGFGKIGYREL